MKIRKNNRGFTLVELIVSMAILAIIAVGASAFMVAGTKAYSNLNYTVRLQYEAQLAMAQLQEYTIDASKGIAWDPTTATLYVANESEVHVFDFDDTTDSISYGSGTPAENLTLSTPALVAEHVESMSVVCTEKQIEITMNMARGNKQYTATQVIALRNQLKVDTSWSNLWARIKPAGAT